MVMFPDPQPYINPRIDPHRTSARRPSRHHPLGVGAASGALTKSVSMSAHLGKVGGRSILHDRCLCLYGATCLRSTGTASFIVRKTLLEFYVHP